MSKEELKMVYFANYVEANNVFASREAFEQTDSEGEKIMMKAILLKSLLKGKLNLAMSEFANSVI